MCQALSYRSSQRQVNHVVHKAHHVLKIFGLYLNFGLYVTQVWSEWLDLVQKTLSKLSPIADVVLCYCLVKWNLLCQVELCVTHKQLYRFLFLNQCFGSFFKWRRICNIFQTWRQTSEYSECLAYFLLSDIIPSLRNIEIPAELRVHTISYHLSYVHFISIVQSQNLEYNLTVFLCCSHRNLVWNKKIVYTF